MIFSFIGTKQSYTGPLRLVESIRIALGDDDISDKQCSSSKPEDPGDKSQNDTTKTQKDEIRRREVS